MTIRTPVVSLSGKHDELPSGDTLPGSAVQVSAEPDNGLSLGGDGGLFVPQRTAAINVSDTDTIALVGDGTASAPLSAQTRLVSSDNLLTSTSDGLLVKAADLNATLEGAATTEAVTPWGMKAALGAGFEYPVNVHLTNPDGAGGSTIRASLNQSGGGGSASAFRAFAMTTGASGSVRLFEGSVNSANNIDLYGLDLNVQSSATNTVRGINVRVRGASACSGLNIDLSTSSTLNVNSLRFSTADNGLYVKGNIAATGTIVPLSDARLKRKIAPITGATARIKALPVYTYEITSPEEVESPQARYVPGVGPLAQEAQDIDPGWVQALSNGFLGVSDRSVFYTLLRAFQELEARVAELETAHG